MRDLRYFGLIAVSSLAMSVCAPASAGNDVSVAIGGITGSGAGAAIGAVVGGVKASREENPGKNVKEVVLEVLEVETEPCGRSDEEDRPSPSLSLGFALGGSCR